MNNNSYPRYLPTVLISTSVLIFLLCISVMRLEEQAYKWENHISILEERIIALENAEKQRSLVESRVRRIEQAENSREERLTRQETICAFNNPGKETSVAVLNITRVHNTYPAGTSEEIEQIYRCDVMLPVAVPTDVGDNS